MLERLMEFGVGNGYFCLQALGKLAKSCCTDVKIEVIDFDKTKEMVSKEAPIKQPKSADALKIFPQLNRLDFIELKGFEHFIKHKKNLPELHIDKAISQQIEDFCLSDKIKHSLHVLWFLIQLEKFNCTNSERQQYQQVKKNYFIVVDVDLYHNPMLDRAVTLAFLSEDTTHINAKITANLRQAVADMPSSDLENLAKPKLFNCKSINRYYGDLLNISAPNL